MFQLRLATSGKVLGAAICREPGRVPESNRRLHTKLILECSQRGSSVVGPVTPGAASQAVLHKHKCSPSTKVAFTCVHIYTYMHDITLHYITSHYSTLKLHYITLHYCTLHTYINTNIHTYIQTNITYITLHYSTLHCITSRHIT